MGKEEDFLDAVDEAKQTMKKHILLTLAILYEEQIYYSGVGDYTARVAITETIAEITPQEIEDAINARLNAIKCVHCGQNMFHKSSAQ